MDSICRKHSERQVCANKVDCDDTSRNAASSQGLNYFPLIQRVLDTTTCSKLYFLKLEQVW